MIHGYDIANVNGPDFVFPDDADFVVAKVTQDAKFVDKDFDRHRRHARELGIPFGGYHYADINEQPDPERSLGFFLNNLGNQDEGEFAALDAEQDYGYGGLTPGDPRNRPWLVAWGAGFIRAKNYKPKLYIGRSSLTDFGLIRPEIPEVFDLWYAWWSDSKEPAGAPASPLPFDDYMLWQYNADNIDKNVFFGTAEELRATGHTTIVLPEPPDADYEELYWTPTMAIINNLIANSTHRHADQALHATISNAITANKIAHGVESPF